jgi:hypothetical protein
MTFPQRNTPYTRTDIKNHLGGEIQTYLPQNKKIILAGCFTVDSMNPDAPAIIQAGNAPKVAAKAKLLSSPPHTVFPVFLKQKSSDKHYFFEGCFKFKSISNDAAVIAAAELRSGRFDELSYVLELQRV